MNDGVDSDDPFGSGFALTYGIHADAYKCGLVDNDCAAGLMCVDEEHGATKTDPQYLHCVDPATMKSPLALNTPVAAIIRIISKELLDGETLEQFACACHGNCPVGAEWTLDPENCSVCGDDPATTIDESGRCLDVNNDRIPDLSTLLPGVATITCDGVADFGVNGTYVTQQGDGYYYPSGNRFLPAASGYSGVGPAVVIQPAINLPAGSVCTISVSSSVKDKDGNSFDATDGSITFGTEAMAIASSTPAEDDPDDETDNAEVTDTIEIEFNANVAAATVSATTVGVRLASGGPFLPLDLTKDDMGFKDGFSLDGGIITLALAAELLPGTNYEIVIPAGVTDEYGQLFSADETIIAFETAAAE